MHDFDENIFSDFSDEIETFGQLKELFSLCGDLIEDLNVLFVLDFLFMGRIGIGEILPPVGVGSVCISYLIIICQQNLFLCTELVWNVFG